MKSLRINMPSGIAQIWGEGRSQAGNSLLDVIMPEYGVMRRQSRVVRAPAAAVYTAMLKQAEDRVPGAYVILTKRPGKEIVLGGTHPFRAIRRLGQATASLDEWCGYQRPGNSRVALSLRVEPLDYQTARLHAETRVQTRGVPARLLFRVAWALARPAGSLLRRSLLRQTQKAAEHDAGLFLLTS